MTSHTQHSRCIRRLRTRTRVGSVRVFAARTNSSTIAPQNIHTYATLHILARKTANVKEWYEYLDCCYVHRMRRRSRGRLAEKLHHLGIHTTFFVIGHGQNAHSRRFGMESFDPLRVR